MNSIIPIVVSNSIQKSNDSNIDLIEIQFLDSNYDLISSIPLNASSLNDDDHINHIQLILLNNSFYFKIPTACKLIRLHVTTLGSNAHQVLESELNSSKPIVSFNQQTLDYSNYKISPLGNAVYSLQLSLPSLSSSGILNIGFLDSYRIKLGVEYTSSTSSSTSKSQLTKFPDSIAAGGSVRSHPSSRSIFEQLSISLEDGPALRNLLLDFENKITKLKSLLKSSYDNSTQFDSLIDQLQSINKSQNMNFMDLQKSLPATTLNFYKNYQNDCGIGSEDTSGLNILNLLNSASKGTNKQKTNSNYIRSMISKKEPVPSTISTADISITNQKRIFEEESKKYYDWISKLLSSGKEKDDKLLSKRKDFELAKMTYFNFLFDQLLNISFESILLNSNSDSKDAIVKSFDTYRQKFVSDRSQLISKLKASKSISDLNALLNLSKDSINKSGILFTQGGQGKLGWHKQWVVLRDGKLYEFMDWRSGKSQRFSDPVDISLSNIKKLDSSNSNISKRKNCFRIITSKGDEHFYQAIDEIDRDQWIDSLFLAGQQINFNKSNAKISVISDTSNKSSGGKVSETSTKTSIAQVPRASESSRSLNSSKTAAANGSNSISTTIPHAMISDHTRARRVSSVSSNSVILVQNVHPSNLKCCDCNSDKDVEWISINLLIVFCINCSGIHRNLGTSISKVRSLKLDSFHNNRELFFLLSKINNQRSNLVYEELLGDNDKSKLINPDSKPEERKQFITDKYQFKKYVNFTNPSLNKSSLLIHGVKNHNIFEILHGFALNVDPNLKVAKQIQSQDAKGETIMEDVEFSIFEYALLNPTITYLKSPLMHQQQSNASQLSGTSSDSTSSSISADQATMTSYMFETAELLVLNGTSIETKINTSLKLSNSALQYWQTKIDKVHGTTQSSNSSAVKSTPIATPTKIPTSSAGTYSSSKSKASTSTTPVTSPSNTSKKFNLLKRRPKII